MPTTTDPQVAEVIQLRWHPAVSLPTRLRLVRKDHGARIGRPQLTQTQFAEMLAVNPNTYRQWEGGHSKPADLETFALRVYRVTGCDPAWLLGVSIDLTDRGPDGPPDQEIARGTCSVQSLADKRAEKRQLAVEKRDKRRGPAKRRDAA